MLPCTPTGRTPSALVAQGGGYLCPGPWTCQSAFPCQARRGECWAKGYFCKGGAHPVVIWLLPFIIASLNRFCPRYRVRRNMVTNEGPVTVTGNRADSLLPSIIGPCYRHTLCDWTAVAASSPIPGGVWRCLCWAECGGVWRCLLILEVHA